MRKENSREENILMHATECPNRLCHDSKKCERIHLMHSYLVSASSVEGTDHQLDPGLPLFCQHGSEDVMRGTKLPVLQFNTPFQVKAIDIEFFGQTFGLFELKHPAPIC